MGLYSYAEACRTLRQELVDSLSKDDIKALRESLADVGAEGWYAWFGRSLQHITAFISATPSERKRKKSWQEPVLRAQLTLAAIQHVQRAEAVLETLSSRMPPLGVRNRDMAAVCGELYLDILHYELKPWPFPGRDPFAVKK